MCGNRKCITAEDNTLKMLSIDLLQHQILCLVSVIIITSGLDNFPRFPFISDTKEGGGGRGCGCSGGRQQQQIFQRVEISSKTFDLHCLLLWLLKEGNEVSGSCALETRSA